LQKAAIEQVPTSSLGPGFYSRLFLVPKKKGGMRPVIDLSILNSLGMRQKNVWVEFLDKRIVQVRMNLDR
jgi:hypothetical protein